MFFWMVTCGEGTISLAVASEVVAILEVTVSSILCPPEVPRPAVNIKCGAPCGIFPPGGIDSTAFCRSVGVKSFRESNHVCHVLPSTSCSSTKRLEIVSPRVVASPFSFAQKVVMRLNFSRLRELRNVTPFSINFWACLENDNRSNLITSCGAAATANSMPRWIKDSQSVT